MLFYSCSVFVADRKCEINVIVKNRFYRWSPTTTFKRNCCAIVNSRPQNGQTAHHQCR